MTQQKGFAHAVLIIGLVIALVGALGFVFWQNFIYKEPVASETDSNIQADNVKTTNTKKKVIYKTVPINGSVLRYPLNDNNEKIIIVAEDASSALEIAYSPIRKYYHDKDVSEHCKEHIAGLINAQTRKELLDGNILPRFIGKDTIEEALADGSVVQVGDKDLYLSGPTKQDELCTDIYQNNDSELRAVLTEVNGTY